MAQETVALGRPTGPAELELVEQADWRAGPPRLPDQPTFYPVLDRDYASRIAREPNVPASGSGYVTRFEVEREPNVPASGSGYVTRFEVEKDDLDAFEVHPVGGTRSWSTGPGRALIEFDRRVVGVIEVVDEYC